MSSEIEARPVYCLAYFRNCYCSLSQTSLMLHIPETTGTQAKAPEYEQLS